MWPQLTDDFSQKGGLPAFQRIANNASYQAAAKNTHFNNPLSAVSNSYPQVGLFIKILLVNSLLKYLNQQQPDWSTTNHWTPHTEAHNTVTTLTSVPYTPPTTVRGRPTQIHSSASASLSASEYSQLDP